MNKQEFIQFLLEEKALNKKVFEKSKNIVDFPLAYKILNSIDGSDFIQIIINPKNLGEIDLAKYDLEKHNVFKDSEIKKQVIKFINELAEQSKLKFRSDQYSTKNSKNIDNDSRNIIFESDRSIKRQDLIELLLTKKIIDEEILNFSKEVENFSQAQTILKSISNNKHIETILNAKEINEIDFAKKKFQEMNLFSKGKSHLKQQGDLFINELVSEKKLKLEYIAVAQSQEEKRNNRPRGKVIGIDLGTTNSLASIIENGQASAIPLKSGERMIPSVITITKDNKFDVGENAKRQQIINPEETFYSIKRFIGRRSAEIDQSLVNKYTFNIDNSNDKIGIYSKKLDRRFECEELSAQILLEIKSNAERFLNESINDCVITVPAYFDNNQRVATKKAAQIAGLNVQRLISEPTAAAFAYEISRKNNNNSVSLIVDLGGGTFDISMVKSTGNNVDAFSVIATLGDRELGGDDFTNKIVEYVSDSIQKENIDFNLNPSIKNLIREEAVKAKHELSFKEQVEINFPMLPTFDNKIFSHSITITQDDFVELSSEIIQRISNLIQEFLEIDKVKKQIISKVVCVGGASRMPIFLKTIEDLTNLKPQIDINPDEVISHGAAFCSEYTLSDIVKKTIIDVTPLSLGVKTFGDIFSVLIPANTSLPTRKSDEFSTVEDFQSNVEINVYQGDRKIASDNIFLESFILNNLEQTYAGNPRIEVNFEIDIDGILKVSARDKITDSEKSIEISNSLSLSFEEIEKMRKLALEMTNIDTEKTKFSLKVNELFALKKVFDSIKNPILKDSDKTTLDKIEKCISTLHESGQDPDQLIFILKKIIKDQEKFSTI